MNIELCLLLEQESIRIFCPLVAHKLVLSFPKRQVAYCSCQSSSHKGLQVKEFEKLALQTD